jgi:ubiquinone/menaquinone biosynthesis C-methylase UbiE
MIEKLPFNEHVNEYEGWFKKYPLVFRSEVAAIKALLPKGKNIRGFEIGVGTGRFAKALGIQDGIEPAPKMRELATRRGIFALNAVAEDLPYKSGYFDFVLMNFCISYLKNVEQALGEARRVLKNGGILIVGFLDKNSPIGIHYERRKPHSLFYRRARFYTAKGVAEKLKRAGFPDLEFFQTLFHQPGSIRTVEVAKPGYGEGSYILIRATK